MAAQSREIYARLLHVLRTGALTAADARPLLDDLVDQFERVRELADGQLGFLLAVIDSHRARTDTKMMVAAERLAVIAAVTLPITALSSVMGMNVIVNSRSRPVELVILLVIMVAMSLWLLRWTRRQGWW
jgi:Mg2+ and Co2+ transporter CorA